MYRGPELANVRKGLDEKRAELEAKGWILQSRGEEMTAAVTRDTHVRLAIQPTLRRIGFVIALIGAVMLFSQLAQRSAPVRTVWGTVDEFRLNELIVVKADPPFDPRGFPFSLSATTKFEGFSNNAAPAIAPGARVQIIYRSLGERQPIADRVRFLEVPPR